MDTKRVVASAKKYRLFLLSIIGVPTVADLIKEHYRGKLMDWGEEYLGSFGRWLFADTFSILTLVLAAALLFVAVVVLAESIGGKDLPILEDEQNYFKSAPHRFGLSVVVVMLVCIACVAYGAYRYETLPSHSRNRLRWAGADVFSENRYIETGQALGFKFYFTPNQGYVADTHAVAACVIAENETPAGIAKMISEFQMMVKENLKEDKNEKGIEVYPGTFVNEDAKCPALSSKQSEAVLNGTAKVYVLLWFAWVGGEDKIRDETQYCFWLGHPVPFLQEEDAKRWNICSSQLPTEKLW